ncbi:MAG: FKBP-type peptidyl-prolyl cis-trans isomerase [Vicinamibacterales bacterium]
MTRLHLALCLLPLVTAGCSGNNIWNTPTPLTVPFSTTDLRVGTGVDAQTGRTVTVNYTGWLYSSTAADNKGAQFDTSLGRGPFEFTIGASQVIRGWDRGVPGMRVGGRRKLVLPPEDAYGSAGSGNTIPPNATLVFEIDLLTVQ